MTAHRWQQTLEHVTCTHGWPVPAAEELYRPAFCTGALARSLTGDPA